jgi:hypothetical protein
MHIYCLHTCRTVNDIYLDKQGEGNREDEEGGIEKPGALCSRQIAAVTRRDIGILDVL